MFLIVLDLDTPRVLGYSGHSYCYDYARIFRILSPFRAGHFISLSFIVNILAEVILAGIWPEVTFYSFTIDDDLFI